MFSNQKAEWVIGWILLVGISVSALIILSGGILFLIHHGHDNIQILLQNTSTYKTLPEIVNALMTMKATSVMELGILMLVATQVLRVGLLAIFYIAIRDMMFTSFSLFILAMLLYSFVFPH